MVMLYEKAEFNTVSNGIRTFFVTYSSYTHCFEKYVTIKIEDNKILVLMSILLPKLDDVNASYPCKYNSIL